MKEKGQKLIALLGDHSNLQDRISFQGSTPMGIISILKQHLVNYLSAFIVHLMDDARQWRDREPRTRDQLAVARIFAQWASFIYSGPAGEVDTCALFCRVMGSWKSCVGAMMCSIWSLVCLEADLGSFFDHPWSVKIGHSYKVLHNCSTWRRPYIENYGLRFPYGQWTLCISLEISSPYHFDIRWRLFYFEVNIHVLFYALVFKCMNGCLPIASQRMVWLMAQNIGISWKTS